MKYTDWVIPRLKNLEHNRTALLNIPDQIHTLEMSFSAIRSAATDGTPVSGGENMREEALIANIAEREQLKRNLEITCREVKIMDSALNSLPEDERLVLDRFFIHKSRDYKERLCNELHCERATLYRLKDKGLIDLARQLYGQVTL